MARDSGDDVTLNLFTRILKDEEEHHRLFSSLI
jgi:bacterioferritin (cytochrome b1)